jgi:hypothetical protein
MLSTDNFMLSADNMLSADDMLSVYNMFSVVNIKLSDKMLSVDKCY